LSTFQAQLNPDLSTGNAGPHENSSATLDIKSSDASLDVPGGGGDGGIKEENIEHQFMNTEMVSVCRFSLFVLFS